MHPKKETPAVPEPKSSKRRCAFALMMFFWLSACSALPCWGWGDGHDGVARLYGAHLPEEIRAFLGDWGGNTLTNWCHHPDHFPGHPDQTLDLTGAIVGDAYKAAFGGFGYSNGDWLHRHAGRAATLVLLRQAFREGNAKNAAFLLSVLSHSVSDQGALNHTPILQFVSYSGFKGVNYGRRHGCEFSLKDGDVATGLAQSLADYTPKLFAPKFDDAVVKMVVDDGYWQSEISAEIEIDAAYGTRERHVAAMARIVAAQVESLLDMAWTCWRLKDDPAEFTPESIGRLAAREEERRREGNPRLQAVYHGLFDESLNPAQPKATVGLVCEPYGSFHVKALSFVGKMLTAAAGRTLRDAGYAVMGISYWEMEKTDLPAPSDMQILLIDTGSCAGMSEHHASALGRYVQAGGRLFAIGGNDPRNVTGLKRLLVRRRNDEVPVSSGWNQEGVGDWDAMKVLFPPGLKRVGTKPVALVRNPNFDGFCKPCCIWSLKDDPSLKPLVRLDNGRETLIVGGVVGNVCWMPEYLFLPFLFSQDRTVDWADMRLDAFGTNVLLDAMDALQNTL